MARISHKIEIKTAINGIFFYMYQYIFVLALKQIGYKVDFFFLSMFIGFTTKHFILFL